MKKLVLILLVVSWVSFVNAGTIQEPEAKIIALNWINSQGGDYFKTADIESVYSKVENKVPIFYIISLKPCGWVIVSASDFTEPVLGYSVNTQFDINQMPPQVKGWIDGKTSEIESAIKIENKTSYEIKQKWQSYSGKLIDKVNLESMQSPQAAPLLATTWNQGKFYNEMAPIDESSSTGNDHVWLGCVATAMAQLMKYWEYPASGMGSHSYSHPEYGTLSADFANTSYNWAAMPNNANSTSFTEVQKLGYHCAVSVDMDFGPNSSGAFLSDAAFFNYFRYNSTIFESEKNRWDEAEWIAQLKREINSHRPMIYSGYNQSYTSGHAWVCDGYSGDYFHFNWGWGGAYNGNFLLSALTPGSNNFSYNQAAQFSIEPVTPTTLQMPYNEGFESGGTVELSLMGVSEVTATQSHTGTNSLKMGKESIVSYSTNAASLCFLVPLEAELNFWVKRFTPDVSINNQQKAYIMPQYGSTPLIEIYNGDFVDSDWEGYNVNLSAYAGQIVRLLFLQEVTDFTRQQWMYIDDISISGISNNLAPYIPSNPNPSNQANYVTLNPNLHWACGDPNGDGLTYNVYFGTTTTPPFVGSVSNNNFTIPVLNHSTTYYWKIIADDGNLTTEGPLWSFTTKGIPPTMNNCGVTNLTSTSMIVCGEILDYNLTTVSSRGICWSQSINPSLSTNYIEAEETTNVFSCNISGLLPFTKYYYRAYANSNQGPGFSDVLNLTTLADLPKVSIVGIEDILRSTASVIGTIDSVNDSSIFRRGVVWSTVSGFNPLLSNIVSENGVWADTSDFSINLTNLPGPGNIFLRVFAENTAGIAYSDESSITMLNHAPFIDLDVNNSKGAGNSDYLGKCFEQLAGGKICDSDVEISDPDGDTIRQIEVKILNPVEIEAEFLTVLPSIENLIVVGEGTGQLVITSNRSLSNIEWKEVVKSIEYRNNLDSPDDTRTWKIQVQTSDGFDNSNIAIANLNIIPVNDPPVIQVHPSLMAPPVFGSRLILRPGIWADILDNCNGIYSYSYSWQMKNETKEIVDLNFDNQLIIPVNEILCGNWVRVVEKITDEKCGGTNVAVDQAESEWYQVGQAVQTLTLDPITVHSFHESQFKLKGNATSGLPVFFSVPQNNILSISNDTAYIKNTGTVVISGVQPGNECYLPSLLLYRIVTIEKSVQNIEFEKTIESKFHERRMKIPASATSGLGLIVSSSDSSIAYVVHDTIYFTGTGQVNLTITQPGNKNYFPAVAVVQNLTILKGDQSIITKFPDDMFYGKGSYPFSAISSSQLEVELSSSDPSILEISDDSLIVHGVGEVLISAKQPGNKLWNPADVVLNSLIVKKGTPEIFVEAIEDKVFLGASFIPVSHSSNGLNVAFSVQDTSIADVVDGHVVIKNVGETVVDFAQNGNALWESAFSQTPLRIVKAKQVVIIDTIENQIFGFDPVVLFASSSSGLDVEFEISNHELGTISGDTLYIHKAGTAVITAIQSGNHQFNPSEPVSINLLVEKATQSIFSHLPDSLFFDHQIIFADVESTSGLSVGIVSSDEGIVKVVSDSLNVTGPGEVILTLSQPGNENFLSAEASVKIVVSERVNIYTVEDAHFSIFPNPTEGNVSMIIKDNSTYPLQISIINSTGKTIFKLEMVNSINHLDLSNQPQGLYFVVLRSHNGMMAQKLLIAR